jgi:hypothetical protein
MPSSPTMMLASELFSFLVLETSKKIRHQISRNTGSNALSLEASFLIRSAINEDLVTLLAAAPRNQQLVRQPAADNNVSETQKNTTKHF